jgi:hypothetical protein
MTAFSHDVARPIPSASMRVELNAAVDIALPQTPGQFGARLIKEKWGADIDPQSALLLTLDYNYKGHPAQNGIQQGQVASSHSLLQALLSNYQTVGDGRFAETAFGLYTPPDIGPAIRIVEHVDEFANHGSGNHETYEGIYRQTIPQTYGPLTQIAMTPAEFKKWVWELDLQDVYSTYLDHAWPSDEAIIASRSYGLRTSVKAAFVMTAWLQRHEQRLSQKGLELAMRSAGLPHDLAWKTLTFEQLQAPTHVPSAVKAGHLKVYRYTSTDIWTFRDTASSRVLLYVPGNSSALHEFADAAQLRQWVVTQGSNSETKQALSLHFADDDRDDGTFHAGVLTALDGMAIYPREHRLTNNAGFFNNDGYWDPAEYIGFDDQAASTDPFAQLVLTMKQAAKASIKTIRDDAQVNRDNLRDVVEPIVQWVNRYGPLALFVPGGEGLLALAGLIDAGFGLDEAVNGKTPNQRSEGVTRTVFGLLNALPLAGAGAGIGMEEAPADVRAGSPLPVPEEAAAVSGQTSVAPSSRVGLLRGIGPSVASFGDEVLAQIGKISAIDDDMLRLMQSGRPPTPLLADTISRFKIDQDLGQAANPELFNSRYDALQQSEHEWVRLFQREYPGLPKSAIEQMLDRYGVDVQTTPEVVEARQVFMRLDDKARQYQQHVRLNRAYEGLYLRSVISPDSETLALHSLKNLSGWPKGLRIDVLDQSVSGRVLDRCGPLDAADCRRLIKAGNRYQHLDLQTDFYDAVFGLLSSEECSVLQLSSVGELRLKIRDHALSRTELMTGLDRMNSRLPFEAQQLSGGGFPSTPQAEALSHKVMRLQLKDIYPDFTDAQADEVLQRHGTSAQAHIEWLKQQMQQLNIDLNGWMDQVVADVNNIDLAFLAAGDDAAAGLSQAQIEAYNVALVQSEIQNERAIRIELAEELVAIWQKRGPQQNIVYSGQQVQGVRLDMAFEDYHRLPALNVRLNDVIELSLRGLHVTMEESLDGFLENFPNLRVLNLEGVDLRSFFVGGEGGRAFPPVIGQLTHLTSLNVRSTQLVFTGSGAAQLRDLARLQILNLSDNPLGMPPMVLGMDDLRQLNLRNTQITGCPIGIREEPYLTTLDLRDNRITRVPPAVMNQAVADDRVLLWGNPLTDEDTLRRLISHREQTGINVWLSAQGADYGTPMVWLRDCDEALQQSRQALWQRLAGKPSGTRFLAVIDRLSLTPDFQVSYLSLQARVWRLLQKADASEEMWGRLSRSSGRFDRPMVAFTALEVRAGL